MSLNSQRVAGLGMPDIARDHMACRLIDEMAVVFAEDAQLFAAELDRGTLGAISASEAVLLFAKKLRAIACDLKPPSSLSIFG